MVSNIFQKILSAAIIGAVVLGARVLAQSPSGISSPENVAAMTNLTQPKAGLWKSEMLRKELRSGVFKSFEFNSSSLNGVAVHPTPSAQQPSSAENRRRKEMLEQAKYLFLMNSDDPSASSPIEEMLKSSGGEMTEDDPASTSFLEKLYLQNVQRERGGTTNQSRNKLNFRNDSSAFAASGKPNPLMPQMNAQAGSLSGKTFDTAAAPQSQGSIFPDLFHAREISSDQLRAQQSRINEFRQLLDSRSSESAAPGSWNTFNARSDLGGQAVGINRTFDNYSGSPVLGGGYKSAESSSANSTYQNLPANTMPVYTPTEPLKPPQLQFDIPRRKF